MSSLKRTNKRSWPEEGLGEPVLTVGKCDRGERIALEAERNLRAGLGSEADAYLDRLLREKDMGRRCAQIFRIEK